MIEKIQRVLDNNCQMRYASKVGVRTLQFTDGKVLDPNGEVASYTVEKSYDGKILLRFFNDGPAGYLHYKRDGIWQGNNRSVWTELTPTDPTVWAADYEPQKKQIVQPIKEHLRDLKEFDSYESEYDFEATTEEAIVVLVASMNTKVLENIQYYQQERDLIIEVDGLPTIGRVELLKRIEEAAPQAHIVKHGTQFGLGRLIINAHENALKKYKRVFFMVDDGLVAPNAVNLAFNLHTASAGFAASVYGISNEDGEPYEYKTGKVVNGYVISSEDWQAVREPLMEYKELFLTTKYESRPHHSILQWLKTKGIYSDSSDVLSVMTDFAGKPSYTLVVPRITRLGEPFSHTMDNRRKTFKEAGNE